MVGILNIKDIFMHQATSETPVNVRAVMRPPYFVPENKKLDRMLHQFKARKNHMAIVVDEYGGVSGLLTIEDVLEEIVGEIDDHQFAVLNANSINGLKIDRAAVVPIPHLDNQTIEERQQRWQRSWIPKVEISYFTKPVNPAIL